MTATLTRKTKAKRQDEPLRTINGLSFNPPCSLDQAEQDEADEINGQVDGIARHEEALQNDRERILKGWFDSTFRELQAESARMIPLIRAIEEEKREILTRLGKLRPRCQPAHKRALREAEVNEQEVLDRLEKAFRDQGIDEYSLPNGQHANANEKGARRAFRVRLGQEPEAMAARAFVNKAKSDINVLVSQFPIVPTENNTRINWRPVGAAVPPFISQLFI